MTPPWPAVAADTDPEADRVQIELLRAATPERRAELALGLSAQAISLARRARAEQSPGATDRDIGLRFVELSYGRELAAELAAFLRARR